jgi:hypothetical protein
LELKKQPNGYGATGAQRYSFNVNKYPTHTVQLGFNHVKRKLKWVEEFEKGDLKDKHTCIPKVAVSNLLWFVSE